MLRDLRHAVRMLLQSKGWTSVVLLSLALGIGANTALFSAINSQMLRKIPVADPDGLVRLRWSGDNDMATSRSEYGSTAPGPGGVRTAATFSYAAFEQLRDSNETMTDLFVGAPYGRVNVVVDGEADIASAFIASGSYFSVLGVSPAVGRTIGPDDDVEGAPPVAMISHGYWNRRFGLDPEIAGRRVTINGTPMTIVGVTPVRYTGIQTPGGTAADVHVPLALDEQLSGRERLGEPTWWWLQMMGRLKPGVRPEQVQGNLEGVFRSVSREGMDSYLEALPPEQRTMQRNQDRDAVPGLYVSSGNRGIYDPGSRSSRSAAILGSVVVLVLLIVCANVANLRLSRATARHKEISVRMSMGATRMRLVQQLLTEGVLLSVIGGMLGLLVAYWGRQLLPQGQTAAFDWRVFAFVALLSIATGVIFSLIPALRATRLDVASSLKENSRSVAGSKTRLSKALLVLQVAVSLVLLIGAGLFLNTLRNLRNVEVGFNPNNILLFRVDPRLNGYEDERMAALYQQMQDTLQTIPGVRSVSLTRTAFLSGSTSTSGVYAQGRERIEDVSNSAHMMTVSPEFFGTLEIPLLAGRVFDDRDSQDASMVAVINDAAAKHFFSGENPLGLRFGFQRENDGDIEVVGVVRDVKYSNVRDPEPPTVYLPYLQRTFSSMIFELKTASDPQTMVPTVRETVRGIDPNMPLMNVSTQAEQIEQRFSQERFFALAYSLFGGLALVLASIGLFGLASYNVVRRTNEIGIRMALGAEARDVMRMVLGESLILVAIGVAVGLATALAAGRLISSLLFGLAPTDGYTVVAATLVMILVSAFAGYLPARRASRVDPMVALQYE